MMSWSKTNIWSASYSCSSQILKQDESKFFVQKKNKIGGNLALYMALLPFAKQIIWPVIIELSEKISA